MIKSRLAAAERKTVALALRYIAETYNLTSADLVAAHRLKNILKPGEHEVSLADVLDSLADELEDPLKAKQYRREETTQRKIHELYAAAGVDPDRLAAARLAVIEQYTLVAPMTIADLLTLDRQIYEQACTKGQEDKVGSV